MLSGRQQRRTKRAKQAISDPLRPRLADSWTPTKFLIHPDSWTPTKFLIEPDSWTPTKFLIERFAARRRSSRLFAEGPFEKLKRASRRTCAPRAGTAGDVGLVKDSEHGATSPSVGAVGFSNCPKQLVAHVSGVPATPKLVWLNARDEMLSQSVYEPTSKKLSLTLNKCPHHLGEFEKP